jgi:hypothetical protein
MIRDFVQGGAQSCDPAAAAAGNALTQFAGRIGADQGGMGAFTGGGPGGPVQLGGTMTDQLRQHMSSNAYEQ